MSTPERLVILGASNIRIALPTIFDAARSLVDGPVELLIAAGHGRSYGNWSSVPGRSLPSIVDCGLWRALDQRPATRISALITDIGNDLLYRVEPPQLVDWVAQCAGRLRAREARILMTELPLANLDRLGPLRYRLFRTLFFPPCRLTLTEIGQRAREVNEGIKQVAAAHGIALLKPRSAWYGFDPIHIRRCVNDRVWKKILSRLIDRNSSVEAARLPLTARLRLRTSLPEHRRLFAVQQQRTQPSWRSEDGSSVSFF